MIDFHTHILPKMDDGSRDLEESVQLLKMLQSQGVDTAAATPHYYHERSEIDEFLERRSRSLESLQEQLRISPELRPGAEVRFFEGISQEPDLGRLRIQGTRVLLLEMPGGRWNEYMIREVLELNESPEFQILLAHIERYLDAQKETVWDRLLADGVLMQSNAEHFLRFTSRRRALRMLKEGRIHLLGSDCHNISARRPMIGQAEALITQKLGADFVRKLETSGRTLLEGKEI